MMTDREGAARAIGYLEGFSALMWALAGEKLAEENVAAYDRYVEVLREAIFEEEADE